VVGYTGVCVNIECKYLSKSDDPELTLSEIDGRLELQYDYNIMRSLEIRCEVPVVIIEQLQAETINGKIELESVNAKDIIANSKNAKLEFENINCQQINGTTSNSSAKAEKVKTEKLVLETTNGRIKLEDVKAKSAQLTSNNGKVETEDTNIVNLLINTTNGSIKLKGIQDRAENGELINETHTIEATTTNGSINVRIPRDKGIALQAKTTNGSVAWEYEAPIIGETAKAFINGKNQQYEGSGPKYNINISTTNALIKIGE